MHSSSRLLFSFTCSPLQSLQPPYPLLYPVGLWRLMVSIFFLFHFSSQTNFRKHQLSACMHVQSISSFCASEVQSAELPSVDSDVVMLLPNACKRKDCHTNLEFFPTFFMYTTRMFSCTCLHVNMRPSLMRLCLF